MTIGTNAVEAAQWWFRSRGTGPDQDYVWVDEDGARGGPPEMSWATRLAKPGSLTIVCWTHGNEVLFFADGLRSPTWPRDHHGRPIELSVAARSTSVSATRDVIAALSVVAEPSAGSDMSKVVTFSPTGIGYSINGGEWRRVRSRRHREAGPGANEPLQFASHNRSRLKEAADAVSELVEDRAARGENGDAHLLIVSDLVTDGDAAELIAYRTVGKSVTPKEGPWSWPRGQPVTTKRPSFKVTCVLVIVLLMAVAVVVVSTF